MKKNLLYLFTVLCTMSMFTACSDDDSGDPDGLGVNKSFSGESLDLKYANSPLLGKEISFDTRDGKTATISMKGSFDMSIIQDLMNTKSTFIPPMAPGVIPGEVTTTLSGVPLTLAGDKYTFEGTDSSNGREIKYSGEVSNGKMIMSVTATLPDNALTGSWALTSPYLSLKWETSAKIKVDGAWIGMAPGEIEVPISLALPFINSKLSMMIAGVLQGITFQEDGNIVASYRKAGITDWQNSPINLAQYYVKSNKLYLQLNISQIMATVKGTKANVNDIMELLEVLQKIYPYLSEGLPLGYTVSNGKATVTVEKELLFNLFDILSNQAVMSIVMKKIPAEQQEMVQTIIPQLPAILKETTDISATLTMEKK